jgi:hypothetical protein
VPGWPRRLVLSYRNFGTIFPSHLRRPGGQRTNMRSKDNIVGLMYVCTDVRLYGCMFVRMYVCTDVCLDVCTDVCLYGCMFGCMYVCIDVSTYICTCM